MRLQVKNDFLYCYLVNWKPEHYVMSLTSKFNVVFFCIKKTQEITLIYSGVFKNTFKIVFQGH